MKSMMKYAVAAALTSALALAAAMPSQARDGRYGAAAIGFGAGALVGAAVAGSAYNNGYYGPGYAPGYYADPGYAYAPEPVYVAPRRAYRGDGCWIATDTSRGYGYYGPCY
jgi:hypothetical protein